jgi:hypothetical protein
MPLANRLAYPLLFAVAMLALAAGPAAADIDPETFPAELRALEWRAVGPWRGGRSAAVAGIPSDPNT